VCKPIWVAMLLSLVEHRTKYCKNVLCGGGRHSCIFKVVRACAFVVRNVKGWNCVENCLGCNVAEVDEMLSRLGPMICTLLY
jgi:hypothetical protein